MKKVYMLQFIVYSFVLLLFLSTVNCQLSTVYAIVSTPAPQDKSILDAKAAFEKEVASKAAQLKSEIDKKLQNKAYVGKLKVKSENSLTIAARSGPKIVTINQDTIFESQIKKTKFSQKTLSEEDYLAALGDIDETGVLTAKKITLLDPKPFTLDPKIYLWGQIIAISDKLITLKDRNLKSIPISLPDDANVKLNNFVILSGTTSKSDIFNASFVYVIPEGGFIKPKKVATPSAQISTKSGQTKNK